MTQVIHAKPEVDKCTDTDGPGKLSLALLTKTNGEPLDAERIEIYRVLVRSYGDSKKHLLYLSDVTNTLGIEFASGCTDGISPESINQARSEVHSLPPELAKDAPFQLVGAEDMKTMFHPADPVASAMSPPQVRLLSLSEIAFNKKHDRAAMNYAYSCGNLCGNGALVVFEKTDKGWRLSGQECGRWIS